MHTHLHKYMFCVFLVTLAQLTEEPLAKENLPLLKKPLILTFRS